METLGLAALFALCGDGKGVIESLVALPVHSLQLNSDADLLKCFLNDEQRDSRLNFDFSRRFHRKCSISNKEMKEIDTECVGGIEISPLHVKIYLTLIFQITLNPICYSRDERGS